MREWRRLAIGLVRRIEGTGQARAGLGCPGGSHRVVCYLSTPDQSHLPRGEGEEAGCKEPTCEKVKNKRM